MALDVKLEYIVIKSGDEGVFWHLREDVPVYIDKIDRESYASLGEDNDFLSGLLAIPGVTQISSKAYRLYFMKSPVFGWEEVNDAIEEFLLEHYEEPTINYVGGSAEKNGRGIRLESEDYRREI